MSATSQLQVNRALALRYLGCPGKTDPQIITSLDQAAALVEETMQPRHVLCAKKLIRRNDTLTLADTALSLPGSDIALLLQESTDCILLCATIGSEVDRLIRQWQLKDLSFASMLDACASSAVEAYCDQIENELRAQYQKDSLHLTDRFSPGYGDLPLDIQSGFCAVLDTSRRIGVQVSSSHILIPRKSVTAVLGVCAFPQSRRDRCSGCLQYDTCSLRKEGAYCADP